MPVPLLTLSEYSSIDPSVLLNSVTFAVNPNTLQDTSCMFTF